MKRNILALFAILIGTTAAGIAIAQEYPDPLEGLNIQLYRLTKFGDSLYIKPAAIAYEKVVPPPARSSIRNFFNNMNDAATVVNDFLTGKITQGLQDALRFTLNSTLGIFGLFDVATDMGLERHHEDLGKTLYKWGWKESSFLVIPFFGPSTIRDALGWLGDVFFTPPQYFTPAWRNRYYALEYIDRRSDFTEIEGIAGVAGVNYYSLVRSSYFQHRYYVLTDGQTMPEEAGGEAQTVDLGEPPS